MLQLLKKAGLWGTSGPAANKELMGWVLGAGIVNYVYMKCGHVSVAQEGGNLVDIWTCSQQGAHAGWVEGGELV